MRKTTTGRSGDISLLARIPLTESERRAAEHYMEMGERIADLVLEVAAALSHALHVVGRGARALAGSRSTS